MLFLATYGHLTSSRCPRLWSQQEMTPSKGVLGSHIYRWDVLFVQWSLQIFLTATFLNFCPCRIGDVRSRRALVTRLSANFSGFVRSVILHIFPKTDEWMRLHLYSCHKLLKAWSVVFMFRILAGCFHVQNPGFFLRNIRNIQLLETFKTSVMLL